MKGTRTRHGGDGLKARGAAKRVITPGALFVARGKVRRPPKIGTGEARDAHIKRQVMGREVVVAVTEGVLDFGPWELIFYGEFGGGRREGVLVKIIGE